MRRPGLSCGRREKFEGFSYWPDVLGGERRVRLRLALWGWCWRLKFGASRVRVKLTRFLWALARRR